MGILSKAIKSANEFPHPSGDTQGWHTVSMPGLTAYDHYKNNDYENAYPSITKIVNRFMKIAPYAIDKEKKLVSEANAVEKLYHPNKQMSSVDFREALGVMYLVHPRTHVLVWRLEDGVAKAGGDITPDNIAGYTFLENAVETTVGGKTTYTVNGNTYTDDEVVTLKGMFPYDLSRGYSPTEAARRWSRIDDYIADYQQGFFKNGAIPSGQFIITAPTGKEFRDIKDMMQARHRGAGKNNNVTYTHRPVDPNTGKPSEAQVEWIPFNVDNKNLDLKNIFDQVNQKLDSAFGVPASIRGVGENNNFATAQMDNRNFVENVVDPLTLKIWTRFTHELNRITGGLDYAITYDLELPSVSEDEKVQAETGKITIETITTAVAAGFSVESVISAIEAPSSFKSLVAGYTPPEKQDDMDVDTGGEVDDSPNQPVNGDLVTQKTTKQISSRDYEDIYEDLNVDPASLGCIMLDVKKIDIMKVVPDSSDDLVDVTDRHDHTMGAVAEQEPHVTLLYGLLENGNVWKDKVDKLLDGWSIKTVKVTEVGYFNLPDSYAIVAHIENTTDLQDGHDRLTLLPHINTFSEYRPHMTLAYIKKEADLGKWLTALNEKYAGTELKAQGINYGDLADKKGAAKGTDPKVKQLTPEQETITEQQLYQVAKRLMESQVERALRDTKAFGDPTDDDIAAFVDDAMNIISGLLVSQGQVEQALGVALLQQAGIDASTVTPFKLATDQIERYRRYLKNVGTSYSTDTAQAIRNVLDRANVNGWTNQQLQSGLREVVKLDDYRITRLARTETVRAGGNASLFSMEQIQDQTEAVVYKVWTTTSSDPCPTCAALNGTRVGLRESFVPTGGVVEGTDGGIFVNNWIAADIASIHPNDECVITYEVVR
jgi:phage portal protein BeeE/2'-5' RNA ligase